jgi:hypothetical protein
MSNIKIWYLFLQYVRGQFSLAIWWGTENPVRNEDSRSDWANFLQFFRTLPILEIQWLPHPICRRAGQQGWGRGRRNGDLKRAVQGWIDWKFFLLLRTWIFFLGRHDPSPSCDVRSRTAEWNWSPIIAWSGKVSVITGQAAPNWRCVDLRLIHCYYISSLVIRNLHPTWYPRHPVLQILQSFEYNLLCAPSENIQLQERHVGPFCTPLISLCKSREAAIVAVISAGLRNVICLWCTDHPKRLVMYLIRNRMSYLVTFIITPYNNKIVTCISIARQRLGKHNPLQANSLNNRTSITRQRVSKHTSLTIKAVFSASSVQSVYNVVFDIIE